MDIIRSNKLNTSIKDKLAGGRYFLLLFALWVIVGGIVLLKEEERSVYRLVNEHHTALGDTLFPYVTYLGTFSVVAAGLFLLMLYAPFRNARFILAYILCNLIPFLLTQLLKSIFNAPRPLNYFNKAEWITRVDGQPLNMHHSFPSGHSEGAFALCCFVAMILPGRWAWLGAVLFLIALTVGYSRVYLSQHFYADVYAGSIIGTLCCIAVFLVVTPKRIQ